MIKIQKEDFNSDEEIQNIKKLHSNIGAVTSFIGYVRDNNNNNGSTGSTGSTNSQGMTS